MPNKFQKYEAAVKLNNNKVIVYHNINTGLKKFNNFIKEKFSDKYLFYTVRRIETKEIIGTFKNEISIQMKVVSIYLPKQRNIKNSGYFVRFPFERSEALINRNLFFSDKIVLEASDNFIMLPENIFDKAISNAIHDIKIYLETKNHIVTYNEIKLGEFRMEKLMITKKISEGTEPGENFP